MIQWWVGVPIISTGVQKQATRFQHVPDRSARALVCQWLANYYLEAKYWPWNGQR